jgi:hypothetical protein
MGKPVTTTSGGICFAFPNVCPTTVPPAGPVPIPYPSVGQLSAATGTATSVEAGGNPVVVFGSEIASTSGDEPADPGTKGGKVTFTSYSQTVLAEDKGVVRLLDRTSQNDGNAVGVVLGGLATVLVGD